MYVGIDYSLTSPAICVYDTEPHWFCFRQTKKQVSKSKNLVLLDYPEYVSPEDRYDKLASALIDAVMVKFESFPSTVTIEDFAFAGNGKITAIAEATGVMKNKLHRVGVSILPYSPPTIKKKASGKGNATKREMVDSFKQKMFDIYPYFDLVDDGKDKIPSPISDCIDAYFVMDMLRF